MDKEFEAWLRSVCFQKPTREAKDLAYVAWLNRSGIIQELTNELTRIPQCYAGRDGECHWRFCPQLRDNEPESSNRHCPLDVDKEDY